MRTGSVSVDEGAALLDQVIERSRPEHVAPLMVSKAVHVRRAKDTRFHSVLADIEDAFDTSGSSDWAEVFRRLAAERIT